MSRALPLVSTIISPLILLLLAAGSVSAAERELFEAAQEPDVSLSAAETAPAPEEEQKVEPMEQKGGFLGGNFLSVHGYGGRAEPYQFLRSSRSGGLFYKNLGQDSKFDLEGDFLNDNDYQADLLLDYQGDYRLHLRTESLYHNLDRELLQFPDFTLGGSTYHAVPDPQVDYGLSVLQDTAEFRYRLHNFPLHVNLGYWRLVRQGTVQQRFADVSFEGGPNTVHAEPRSVNQVIQEGRLGLDAHLGWVDIIYNFRVRVFEDRKDTPVYDYVGRSDLSGAPEKVAGAQQHNERPDSSSIVNTVKLHSSLSGGLVTGASYSIEQRENLSRLTDTSGAKHIKATLQNSAGDLVYTPSKEYSLAVKYRRQELDNENRGLVLSSDFVNPVQLVKPPIDTTKDLVSAQLSYRPRHDLSINGEARAEFLTRNNVSALPSPTSWALPGNSATETGSLSVYYRPVNGVRLSAIYNYSTTDHPSYGTSFEQKHEGKLLATYTRSNRWGGSANLIVRREWNDAVQRFLISSESPLEYSPFPLLSRERDTENANVSLWYVPFPLLTVGFNYAYLQSKVDQGVMFMAVGSGDPAASDYLNRSHVYGVSGSYTLSEKADLSLMLQQVRSISSFEPQYTVFSGSSDTSGITDLTRQHTIISTLSARSEYRFTQVITGSLQYNLSDYDEKNPLYSAYNGTVHTVFATVAAKW